MNNANFHDEYVRKYGFPLTSRMQLFPGVKRDHATKSIEFGNIIVIPENQYDSRFNLAALIYYANHKQDLEPNIKKFLANGLKNGDFAIAAKKELSLPHGFVLDNNCYPQKSGKAIFLTTSIQVMHWLKLDNFYDKSEISSQRLANILALISGFLQSGRHLNIRNYENYRHLKNLKFLPITIEMFVLKYWIYHPSAENIKKGIADLTRANEIIKSLDIIKLIKLMSACLDIQYLVQDGYKNLADYATELEEIMALLRYENKLSFAMKNAPPGLKDVRKFYDFV